jgi:CubicO group peptidase (beta-lactamase class C family)
MVAGMDLETIVARANAVVRQAMAADGTPGVVVAVVGPGGKTVRTYGVATVNGGPVTDRTAFAIGSCSKAFTATVAVALAERGLVDLDAPVVRQLPELSLYDRWVTREVTFRDLLSNRVGLSRETMLEYGSALSAIQVVRRAAIVPPVRPFRTGYAYSNLSFVVAAEALSRAGGAPFPALVRGLLFGPLGMRDAAADYATALQLPWIASPHLVGKGEVRQVPRMNRDNGMGSGTIYASGSDLVAWLSFNLGRRRPPVASRRRLAELHEPATIVPPAEWRHEGLPEPAFAAYSLGWGLKEYAGAVVHRHDGSVDGFVASVALLRDHGVGVAVAANASSSLVPAAVVHAVLDRALGVEDRDWVSIVRATRAARRREDAAECRRRWPVAGQYPAPAHTPSALLGRYRSATYGRVAVEATHGELRLVAKDFPRASGRLVARDDGRFDLGLTNEVESADRACRPWARFADGDPAPALVVAHYGTFERVST